LFKHRTVLLSTRARTEDGYALVIALVVMILMLAAGLAALSLADTQTRSTRKQRERETALNLAEAGLYSQAFILASPATVASPSPGWPAKGIRAYPACTLASNGTVGAVLTGSSYTSAQMAAAQCPSDALLTNLAKTNGVPAGFSTPDTAANVSWTSKVQDNVGPAGTGLSGDYQDVITALANGVTVPSWDSNGDKKVWVRASATVRGHTRTVVGLMQVDLVQIGIPRTAVISGSVATGPAGNHPYIDVGSSTVQVRCPTVNGTDDTCADYELGSNNKVSTISGSPSIIGGFSGPVIPDTSTLLQRALADGTYYPGCPPQIGGKDDLRGAVVWVDDCQRSYGNGSLYSDTCTIPGISGNQNCINQVGSNSPTYGILVWRHKTLEFNSNVNFFGVIYHLNSDGCGPGVTAVGCPAPDSNGQEYMVTIQGGAAVYGIVDVDGNGGFLAGSTQGAFTYDPNAANNITGYGTTGLVQNSWRELY
jgi:Tfp pilus assembly protein PilX